VAGGRDLQVRGQGGLFAYAPYEYISQVNNLPNQAYSYRVVTDRHDRPYQDRIGEELDSFLRERGFEVRLAQAGRASLDTAVESLDILVTFLLIMAVSRPSWVRWG
jgi:hypothetical protein